MRKSNPWDVKFRTLEKQHELGLIPEDRYRKSLARQGRIPNFESVPFLEGYKGHIIIDFYGKPGSMDAGEHTLGPWLEDTDGNLIEALHALLRDVGVVWPVTIDTEHSIPDAIQPPERPAIRDADKENVALIVPPDREFITKTVDQLRRDTGFPARIDGELYLVDIDDPRAEDIDMADEIEMGYFGFDTAVRHYLPGGCTVLEQHPPSPYPPTFAGHNARQLLQSILDYINRTGTSFSSAADFSDVLQFGFLDTRLRSDESYWAVVMAADSEYVAYLVRHSNNRISIVSSSSSSVFGPAEMGDSNLLRVLEMTAPSQIRRGTFTSENRICWIPEWIWGA